MAHNDTHGMTAKYIHHKNTFVLIASNKTTDVVLPVYWVNSNVT